MKSFWGHFYRHLAIYSGHTAHQSTTHSLFSLYHLQCSHFKQKPSIFSSHISPTLMLFNSFRLNAHIMFISKTQTMSSSLSLSLSLSLILCISLSFYTSLYLSMSISLSFFTSMYLSIFLCISLVSFYVHTLCSYFYHATCKNISLSLI